MEKALARFRGALSLEKLIAGEAMNNTSDRGGPNGTRSNLQNSSARFDYAVTRAEQDAVA